MKVWNDKTKTHSCGCNLPEPCETGKVLWDALGEAIDIALEDVSQVSLIYEAQNALWEHYEIKSFAFADGAIDHMMYRYRKVMFCCTFQLESIVKRGGEWARDARLELELRKKTK